MRNAVLLPVLLLAAYNQGGSGQPDAQPTSDPVPRIDESNVQLPPSIVASKSFRCKDNSLVHIDFLSDDRSANVSSEGDKPGAAPAAVHVEAPAAGGAMTGGGWTVKGGKSDVNVTVTPPGATKPLSCHTGPQK